MKEKKKTALILEFEMDIPRKFRFCPKPFHGNISARLFVAMAVTFAVFSFAVFPVTAGKPYRKGHKVVKLVIDDFEKLSSDSRYDILGRSIPELLSVALLPYDSIKIVPRAELWNKALSMELAYDEMTLERITQVDILKAVKADYLLQGNFLEYRGTIKISGVLENVNSQKQTIVHSIRIEAKDIFPGVGSMALEVVKTLDKLKAISFKVRSFAVPCFQDTSEQPSKKSSFFKRDLAMSLSSALVRRDGASVVDWKRLERTCTTPARDGFELAKKLDVDAVIGGNIRIENGKLCIYLTFFIDENHMRLDLPSLEGNVDEYFEQKILLMEKVDEFLEGVLTQNGEWRVAELAGIEGNPEQCLEKAKSLLEQNDTSLAVLFLEKALSIRPKYPEAYYCLGLIRLDQTRLEDAVLEFEKAIELEPDFVEAYKALGQTYARLRLYPKSLKAYETVLQLKPDAPGIYRKIGNMYFLKGRYNDSKKYYLKAIEQDPEDVYGYYWLGVLNRAQGNRDEAVSWFKRALKIDPENNQARYSLVSELRLEGWNLWVAGKYRQAEKQFTLEIEYLPTPDAYFYRALSKGRIALHHTKDYLPAIKDYLTGLRLAEENQGPFRNRENALLNLTELYILSRNYNEAIFWAEKCMKEPGLNPRDKNIARSLHVIARILQGQTYHQDLECLEDQIADDTFRIEGWKFDLLKDFVKDNPTIEPDAQHVIIKLIQDMERMNIKSQQVNKKK
jgi:tetratricopeptide (TPR) repeat protein/TolB-like protein